MGSIKKEWCWNNRTPPEEGFWAKDYLAPGTFGESVRKVWIPNRWIDEAKKCQQPGKGFKPLQGCVGCTHLQDSP